MLASTDFITGASSLEQFSSKKPQPVVVDLVVSKLPSNTEVTTLKKIAGSKHVISASIDEDNVKGVCKGTGRL